MQRAFFAAVIVLGGLAGGAACNAVLGIPEAQLAVEKTEAGGLDAGAGVDAAPKGTDASSDAFVWDVIIPDAIANDGSACPLGRKACGAYCVSVLDPATGCGDPSCGACALAHATPICVASGCAVGACELGFQHCTNVPADGCETDTRNDPFNCSACHSVCPTDWGCSASTCVCTTNDSCGDGGVCDPPSGTCSCSGVQCTPGATCNPTDGTCAF